MERYFFRVEYDGGDFAGWQEQNNATSVQSVLQAAFATVVRSECKVVGAGRTDAGVHARGQGAHIDLPDHMDVGRCQLSVNSLLPRAVAISALTRVDPAFHARYSAQWRRYRYYMVTRKMPLWHKRAWMIVYAVDWQRVADALPSLLGQRDFSVFCASGHSARSMECTVKEASLTLEGEVRVLTITANRFLYKMVRSIVGTLVDIGRGDIAEPLEAIIKSRNRKRAGETAPACGLVLDHVSYLEV